MGLKGVASQPAGSAGGGTAGPTPAASTDNAIVRWDGTGGRTLQDSVVTVADTTGTMTFPNVVGTQVLSGDGTTALPGLSFSGEATTGFFRPGASVLAVSLGNNRFFQFANGSLDVGSAQNISWNANNSLTGARDLILSRKAAANIRFGAADVAAPVAQTTSVQGVVAGTANTAGASWTLQGSQSTGTGAGGPLIFQTSPAAAGSASTQNAFATALTLTGNGSTVMKVSTVTNLPSAATEGQGARRVVSDALTPVFGNAVTGGGAVTVGVISNATAWLVG